MKIEQGKIYIVRRGYKGVHKIKIIELTQTSVLFQNMDNKILNSERLTITQFYDQHFITECIEPITSLVGNLTQNPSK